MPDFLPGLASPSWSAAEVPVNLPGLLTDFWARSPLGMCLTDSRGVVVASNNAFCETVGHPMSELVGSSITKLLAPEAVVRGAVSHEAFIGGEDGAVADTTYLHRSGRPIFAHATDTRVRAPDGRVFRLTTLVDLGRQAQGERQLRQWQRAENFAALAADISNDFNNLLSIILGYVAFLQDGVPDAARLGTAVDGIEGAVRRAASLIKQTLYLSRRDEPSFQRIHVSDFVRDFCRMTADTLSRGVEINLSLEPSLPGASIDVQQFHHVLVNLVQRGRELAGEGGRLTFVTQRVAGGDVRAKFADAREPSYVGITLRIEPSAAAFLEGERPGTWDTASRFMEKRRDLAILVVHSILAGHRGHLEIDAWSAPALIFRLYLPSLPEPTPVAEPGDTAGGLPVAPAITRTVLLVDDEETLLHALGFALERHGFEVLKARDGVEAVDIFRENAARVALVVIDLGLPRMSGWEAFMKIKEHTPGVNVIVMSGHLEGSLQSEIIKAGARGYLQKPFAVIEALNEVKRFFASAR